MRVQNQTPASATALADSAEYLPIDSHVRQKPNVVGETPVSTAQGNEGSTSDIPVIKVDVDPPGASDVRDPSRIYYMLIDPTSQMAEEIHDDSDTEGHLVYERMLRDAWEFETDKKELFELRSFDTEIEYMIDAGLEAALDAMESKHATVSGIVVAVMKAMLSSHRALAKYVTGPRRPEVRSIAEIQDELTGEYPRAVCRLMWELYEAVNHRIDDLKRDRQGDEQGNEVRKSVPRRHPWDGTGLPDKLPMDVFSCMTEEELGKTSSIEPPFNICMTNLMDATEYNEDLDSIFSLNTNCDDETRIALRAALILLLNTMNSPQADVCSLIVLMFKKFIVSHRKLAADFDFQKEFTPG